MNVAMEHTAQKRLRVQMHQAALHASAIKDILLMKAIAKVDVIN